MGAAIAERAARRIDALEMGIAGGKFLTVMESIQTTDHGQAMIYGLRRGLRLLIELVTDVVEQGGLGDLRQRQRQRRFAPPAGEVQQVISVSAQGTQGQLANALTIEEGISPSELLALLIEQAIGRNTGQNGGSMDQEKFHSGRACWRQRVKSAAVGAATKELLGSCPH